MPFARLLTTLSPMRRTLAAIALVLPLAACERSAAIAGPEFEPAASPKRNGVLMCVQLDSAGNILSAEPADGGGQCGTGFDVTIWM
ncbi:hypothetical protein [Gemmatimonas sp. UBA7669]|uniref:hypothetical protein n=1 Tax=Gemmatimonas sp. UBA7669 TaxID=1946568 RepID=UPI0025C3EA0C|nr:hypothetical protein [Gemmatimonas sp. UBA7669]